METGRLDFEWGEYPVLPVFEDVIGMLRPRADAKGISLRFCWIGPVPRLIRTDPRRLKQVLLNLIGNAVKFTDVGSVSVESRMERSGSGWRMVTEITDTGIGIAADQLDKIFQPFCQADSSYTRVHEGTGLGLSISDRLAEMLGGTITAESTLGQGSTFTLAIELGPIEGMDQPASATAARSKPEVSPALTS